jgi:hypothetical protein
MPSYAVLALEAVWREQITPPHMLAHLIEPLRAHYGMGPDLIGAAGDNNHLYGRHRSRDWCLRSAYCTNRAYGTQDARDKRGAGNWYRGFDVGIKGQALYDASHRMDELTRSGRCPGIAEWFGTYDGRTVVGWYEGHASSSDASHLWHLHGGVWTGYADDPATMQMIYAAITGEEDDMSPEESALLNDAAWRQDAAWSGSPVIRGGTYKGTPYELNVTLKRIEDKLDALASGAPIPGGEVTVSDESIAEIAEAVADEQHERSAE